MRQQNATDQQAVKRLSIVNQHVKVINDNKKSAPITDVWSYLKLDQYLSEKGIELRKAVRKVMTESVEDLNKHYDQATFPSFMLPKIQATGVNGLLIKGYGSPGVSYLECGAINFEMGKVDASFSTGFAIHNAAALSIYEYGDEEQKQRLLPVYLSFKKMIGFALTEPNFGSYATGLQTTARKVEGGYVLNGEKYWIGNGMTGDCLVWARNEDDGGRIQAFFVDRNSVGFSSSKIERKFALRSVENAHIKLENVFVQDRNRLANCRDFESGTAKVLTASRLMVAWKATGIATGAYEAALKYTLARKQFGRPVAQFQLVQERLSRMLALCEAMISQCVLISLANSNHKEIHLAMGRCSRAKAITGKLGREVVALAREVCGGNGILLDTHVIKAFADMEAIYTYEGTYDINMLVSGRELTGGLMAFK